MKNETPDWFPYEYVGKFHNRALDVLVEAARYSLKCSGTFDVNTLLASLLTQHGWQTNELDFDTETTWSEFSDSLPEIDDFYKNEEISAQEHAYLSEIIGIIDGMNDDLTGSDRLLTAVREVEIRVLSDDDLTQSSLALILSTTSVVRNSIQYWMREAQDKTSIWFDDTGDVIAVAKGVKDTVKKDAKGAVKGGTAAGVRSGGQPTGVLVGAAFGAVKGSAGAAIAAGGKKILNGLKNLF